MGVIDRCRIGEKISPTSQLCAWCLIIAWVFASLIASLVMSSCKSSTWQFVFIMTFFIQLIVDAVVVQSAQCVVVHALVPLLFKGKICAAHNTLLKTAKYLCKNKAKQSKWKTYGYQSLDAPRYFFSAFLLSKHYPNLLESAIIQSYHTNVLDHAGGKSSWQEVVPMVRFRMWHCCRKTFLRWLGSCPTLCLKFVVHSAMVGSVLLMLLLANRTVAFWVVVSGICAILAMIVVFYVDYYHKETINQFCRGWEIAKGSASEGGCVRSVPGEVDEKKPAGGCVKVVPEAYRDLVGTYPFLEEVNSPVRRLKKKKLTPSDSNEPLSAFLPRRGQPVKSSCNVPRRVHSPVAGDDIIKDITPFFDFGHFKDQVDGCGKFRISTTTSHKVAAEMVPTTAVSTSLHQALLPATDTAVGVSRSPALPVIPKLNEKYGREISTLGSASERRFMECNDNVSSTVESGQCKKKSKRRKDREGGHQFDVEKEISDLLEKHSDMIKHLST